MANVAVTVNNNPYKLSCAPGDEERIKRLAAHVDETCKSLTGKLGAVSENRLLLMAAVLISDELFDTRENNGQKADENGTGEEELTDMLDQISFSIEAIVEQLA